MPVLERSIAHPSRVREQKYRFSGRSAVLAKVVAQTVGEPETFRQSPSVLDVYRLYRQALEEGRVVPQTAGQRKASRERTLLEAEKMAALTPQLEGSRP